MMPDPQEGVVLEALRRVFDTAAFMSVWPWDGESGDSPLPDVGAAMEFRGPVRGRMTLRVCRSVLSPLVENMLGESGEDAASEERTSDALRELLNVICGNVLTEWFGDDPIFDLSPPEILASETLAAAPGPPAMVTRFNLENTLAELVVETVPSSPALCE